MQVNGLGADPDTYPGGYERNYDFDADQADPPAPAVGLAASISNRFAPPEVRDALAITALFVAVVAATIGGFLLWPWLGFFVLAVGLLVVAGVFGTGE